jgi:hypothetical protein
VRSTIAHNVESRANMSPSCVICPKTRSPHALAAANYFNCAAAVINQATNYSFEWISKLTGYLRDVVFTVSSLRTSFEIKGNVQ